MTDLETAHVLLVEVAALFVVVCFFGDDGLFALLAFAGDDLLGAGVEGKGRGDEEEVIGEPVVETSVVALFQRCALRRERGGLA